MNKKQNPRIVLLLVAAMLISLFANVPMQANAAPENIAYQRTATASSVESDVYGPEKAVDADGNTRWASATADNQNLIIDLWSAQTVSRVKIAWEAAYASQYQVQVSNDFETWTTVYENYNGTGGTEIIDFAPVTVRYVKLYCIKRATQYGFSVYEFEIYQTSGAEPENQEEPSVVPDAGFKVVGYAPNWYGTEYLDQIPYSQLTHLIYAFAVPTTNGTIRPLNDDGFMTALVSKAHAHGVKVSVAIGGWSYNDTPLEATFAQATNTNAKCKMLADAMLALVDQYQLDGIDVDWEYPQSNTRSQYETLIQYLRTGLDERGTEKYLTSAVAGTPSDGYSQAALHNLDWVNIMAYDGDDGANHSPYSYAVDSTNAWKAQGLSKQQLVVGVPFYERPNWASYGEIVAADRNNAYKDSTTINGTVVYYNGLQTIAQKTDFACDNAGGIMIWEMSQDYTADPSLSLLNRITATIQTKFGAGEESSAASEPETETEPAAESESEPAASSAPELVPPSVVTNVKAVYQDGKVNLTWDDNQAVMYKVVRTDGRSGYINLTYRATAQGYQDQKELIEGQLYYYRVIGYFHNAEGELVMGPQSDQARVVILNGEPEKVRNVQAAIEGKQVTLTWDPAANVRYYKVSRASGATGKYYTMKYNIVETQYTETLTYNGTYRYKVVGYYKDTDGGWVYGELCDTLYVRLINSGGTSQTMESTQSSETQESSTAEPSSGAEESSIEESTQGSQPQESGTAEETEESSEPLDLNENIAYRKTVIVSSTEEAAHAAGNAVDADGNTRWSSAYADNQNFIVDLGKAETVGRFRIAWEDAYASQYQIQVSNDYETWTTVYENYAATGGNQTIQIAPVTARYVKIYCIKRATEYGFSIYEFEIYRGRTGSSSGGASVAAEAKARVLQYFYDIQGNQTVVGIHNREPNAEPSKQTDQAYAVTGQYPALWSGDFLFSSSDVANRWNMIYECERQWNNGSIVQLMLHVTPPTQSEAGAWDGGVCSTLSDSQWNSLITDGGTLNQAWKERLDGYAVYLQYLKDHGVPVLFRPFHEMNQGIFWWAGRTGYNGTAALYRLTRTYLEQEKGLDNIIWVWDMQDLSYNWSDYNPGDAYWDIFAVDVYNGDYFTDYKYNQAVSVAGNKPIAIGECDKLPTASELAAQNRWVFVMSWAELTFSHNTNAEIQNLYWAQNVIVRNELPDFTK